MRNRPARTFGDTLFPARERSGTDSNWRLFWLFAAVTLVFAVILGRLAHVQLHRQDDYISAFEFETETRETIPARDGRILTADGLILAEDVEEFAIHAHYRWLEDPPDERWLRQQTLSRLEGTDRRDPERIAATRNSLLRDRQESWNRLAHLTGVPPDQLRKKRKGIQERVERIVESVETRRRQQAPTEVPQNPVPRPDSWWAPILRRVYREVTQPPERTRLDPVIVREELEYHRLLEGQPVEVAAEIEAFGEQYPGLRVVLDTRRRYPQQELAAQLIGWRDAARKSDATNHHDHPSLHRRIGRSGLEQSYDNLLQGIPGERVLTADRRGQILSSEVRRDVRIGRDLILTLESGLQRRAEELLDATIADAESVRHTDPGHQVSGGAIVVLDARTGAVLAAATAPRFDLSLITDPSAWERWQTDPRRPFVPRTLRMALPPGSVFKSISAVALLESGQAEALEGLECRGFLDRPDRHRCYIYQHYGVGHGDVDLEDAIKRSCNVFFFRTGRQLGPHPLLDWAERFGLGRSTGVDLPGERSGHLPDPSTETWYPGDTLGLAIGQATVTATPLQIARMMAAVANGGNLVTPHLLQRISGGFHSDQSYTPPDRQPIPVISPKTLATVRSALAKVVAETGGTGRKTVFSERVAIAGKTGTAEAGANRQDHAWFAGYAPADRPRIAFAVVLEHGGSGGRTAGPVAKAIVEAAVELGIVEP